MGQSITEMSMKAAQKEIVSLMDDAMHPLDRDSDPDAVVQKKMAHLCTIYGVTPADLVLEWTAYSFNNNVTIGVSALAGFESELRKKRSSSSSSSSQRMSSSQYFHPAPPSQPSMDKNALLSQSEVPEFEMLQERSVSRDSFMSPQAPSRYRRNRPAPTPSSGMFSPGNIASPADGKYNTRKNRGMMVASINKDLEKGGPASSKVAIVDVDRSAWEKDSNFRFMFQSMDTILQTLEERLQKGIEFIRKSNPGCPALMPVNQPSQEEVVVGGRITSGSSPCLHVNDVVLQGDRNTSSNARVRLDMSEMPAFALFEGQTVIVRGFNPTGQSITVKQILHSFPAPKIALGDDIRREYNEAMNNRPLSMMVAAGPFNPDDGLCNLPLHDLLQAAKARSPDILLLCGPFVDRKHPMMYKVPADPDMLFNEMIAKIESALESIPTQVLIVPSDRDLHHAPVFPQPPFRPSKSNESKIVFLPNPSNFLVNDVMFSVTTSDIVFHMGSSQITKVGDGIIGNSIIRNAQMLVSQRSFYPLYPPALNSNVDQSHRRKMDMIHCPDVLIAPSKLHCCVRELPETDTMFLNPGPLVKGASGGTYACIVVHPAPENSEESSKFVERVRTDIIRI